MEMPRFICASRTPGGGITEIIECVTPSGLRVDFKVATRPSNRVVTRRWRLFTVGVDVTSIVITREPDG